MVYVKRPKANQAETARNPEEVNAVNTVVSAEVTGPYKSSIYVYNLLEFSEAYLARRIGKETEPN